MKFCLLKKGFTLIELLIVVAIIAILAAIAIPNFLEAQTRSKVARVKADQRSLANALEAYYVDNNSYPAQASSTGTNGIGINRLPNVSVNGANMPSFRIKKTATDNLMTLTTPVAYITSFTGDPFADTKGATWAYSQPTQGVGWLIWSYGPDCDETVAQTNPSSYAVGGNILLHSASSGLASTAVGNQPYVETEYYNPNVMVPSPKLTSVTYDPSNGTTSRGDVYRQKQ